MTWVEEQVKRESMGYELLELESSILKADKRKGQEGQGEEQGKVPVVHSLCCWVKEKTLRLQERIKERLNP